MRRRAPQNVGIDFSGVRLTHFGGLYLLQRFLQKLHVRSLLTQYVRFAQRNSQYTIAEELLALIYPIALGISRIETTHLLRRNGVFQYLTGLPAYPTPTTLRRFLLRMAAAALPKLETLHDRLLSVMILKPTPPRRVVLDLDSTVLTLYGNQEMARVGYNPQKRGRPSYHPLLCFNGDTKDYWCGELRPGNVPSAGGATDLLTLALAKVPASAKRVTIRADKGFYDHQIVEFLEAGRAQFVIVTPLSQPIKHMVVGLKYRKHRGDVASAEFQYQPWKWRRPYRYAVIRRPIPDDPNEAPTLFPIGRYSYQVMVTNMKLTPLNTWRFYNGRAAIELRIRELKGDYPLAKIPTKHFQANAAFFHILLFSYNLVNWFKRLCLPDEYQPMTLGTLRSRLLLIPAELTRSGNRPTLKLPASFPYADDVKFVLKRIRTLKL